MKSSIVDVYEQFEVENKTKQKKKKKWIKKQWK